MTLPPPYHFIFALGVVWGAAWVIADSKLTLPFRNWVASTFGDESWAIQLLECPACLSFWLGAGAAAIAFPYMRFFGAIAFGLFACGASLVLAALTIGINHHE
jgi:hypothetical protein